MTDIYSFYPPNNPPSSGSVGASGVFWTFDAVEAAMVEAVELWRRSPGGGHWPFAGDGPWQWVRSLEWGDYADADAVPRAAPLTRAEVAQRDAVSGWLAWVPGRDRKLVVLAIGHLVRGSARVSWMRLKVEMGVPFGADGLRRRYGRALAGVCARLNGVRG
jgi:hypothetical protein